MLFFNKKGITMKYIIYGLTDPDTGEVRYIGKSTKGLERPKEHLKSSSLKSKTHKNNWIKSLLKSGKTFGITTIEILESIEKLDEREEFWINDYRSKNNNLTNSTDGGKGSPGRKFSNETIKMMSDIRKQYHEIHSDRPLPLGMKLKKEYFKINNIDHKHCSDCNSWKQLSEYFKNKNSWDGLMQICKQCDLARKKELAKKRKLSKEDFQATYETRKDAISEGIKNRYKESPELKQAISKRNSKAIIGIKVDNPLETIEFESALKAKEANFDNIQISSRIKDGRPHRGYYWKFKQS